MEFTPLVFGKTKKDRTPWGLCQEVIVYRSGEEIGSLYKEAPEMTEWACDAALESLYGTECANGDLRTCKRELQACHKAQPEAQPKGEHAYMDEPEAEPEAQPVQAEPEPEAQAEATPEPVKTDERIAELERQVGFYKGLSTQWKDLYRGLESSEHTWEKRYYALAKKTGEYADAVDAIQPDTPWPDKQQARLDRLLKHLSDEANQAGLAAMYAPTDWAADRYEVLVQSLHRQASQAKKQGPKKPDYHQPTTPAQRAGEGKQDG